MSSDIDNPKSDDAHGAGLRQMIQLMEREIRRLQEELETIKASNHPQRRTLILDRVQRIDERQTALDGLIAPANVMQDDD